MAENPLEELELPPGQDGQELELLEQGQGPVPDAGHEVHQVPVVVVVDVQPAGVPGQAQQHGPAAPKGLDVRGEPGRQDLQT